MKKIFLVAVFVLASIGLTAQDIERPVEPRKPFMPILSILIPCGVPQFYNGEWIKGTAILGAEIGSLAGMVGFSQSYSTSKSNADLAAFGACWGVNLIASGYCIVDSFIAQNKYENAMNKYRSDLMDFQNNAKLKLLNEKNSIINSIKEKTNSPIVIMQSFPGRPNSADGVNYFFNFLNVSDKVLKYVIISASAYNRVDDKVPNKISGDFVEVCKITGPISAGKYYEGAFENVWYNSTISYALIEKIEVIFMDNTSIVYDTRESINGITFPPGKSYLLD